MYRNRYIYSVQKLSVLSKRALQDDSICLNCKEYDRSRLTDKYRLNFISTLPFKLIGSLPSGNISKGKIQLMCTTCGYINNMYWFDLYKKKQGCAKCNNRIKCTYENAVNILNIKNLTMLTEEKEFKHGKESRVNVRCNICGDERTVLMGSVESLIYGCGMCAGNKPLDPFEVYQQLRERDIEWISNLDEYKGVDSTYTYRCLRCDNEWENILDKIKNSNQGCPECIEKSKGEAEFVEYMKLMYPDIVFIRQKTFPGCKNKMLLPFDFYIPSLNLLIELDGEQHFPTRTGYYNESITIRDGIKTKYCKDKNMNFVRISYLVTNKLHLLREIIDEILQTISLMSTVRMFYVTRYNIIVSTNDETEYIESSDGTHFKYFEVVKKSYQDNLNIE